MIRPNVQNLAESFFTKFETRARGREKDAFIARVKEGFREIGYTDEEMMIQKSAIGGKNLVIGAPDAEVLFTAHYDTPMRNGWLAMPFVKTLGMGLSSLLGALILILLMSPGILQNPFDVDFANRAVLSILSPVLFIAVVVMVFFIKNPHNHNDNTSGCIGVYNVATIVAEDPELRGKCAFVLFDREELGLLGSSAFAKWRGKQYPQIGKSRVINLDCIGSGDYLVLASKNEAEAVEERVAMAEHFQADGFEILQKNSNLFGYLSDHAHFSKGVMLAFLKRSRMGGFYIPNIHTGKDTVCDLAQIARLSEAVVKYVREAI